MENTHVATLNTHVAALLAGWDGKYFERLTPAEQSVWLARAAKLCEVDNGAEARLAEAEIALRGERERASQLTDALTEVVDAVLFERDDIGEILDRATDLLAAGVVSSTQPEATNDAT